MKRLVILAVFVGSLTLGCNQSTPTTPSSVGPIPKKELPVDGVERPRLKVPPIPNVPPPPPDKK